MQKIKKVKKIMKKWKLKMKMKLKLKNRKRIEIARNKVKKRNINNYY